MASALAGQNLQALPSGRARVTPIPLQRDAMLRRNDDLGAVRSPAPVDGDCRRRHVQTAGTMDDPTAAEFGIDDIADVAVADVPATAVWPCRRTRTSTRNAPSCGRRQDSGRPAVRHRASGPPPRFAQDVARGVETEMPRRSGFPPTRNMSSLARRPGWTASFRTATRSRPIWRARSDRPLPDPRNRDIRNF